MSGFGMADIEDARPQLGSWPVRNFSLANPSGPDRSRVPAFLRHLADTLERYGAIEVQDIAFRMEIDEDGEACPTATVYFHETP